MEKRDKIARAKFEINNASTKEEVIKLVAVHAREAYKMVTIAPDLITKIMGVIKR